MNTVLLVPSLLGVPLPEPPTGALQFLCRWYLRLLRLLDQIGVALPLPFKLTLAEGHLLLQAAYPLLRHGQRRVAGLGIIAGFRRAVVQHHVDPVPPSWLLPSCLNLPRGDPPVRGGRATPHQG